MTRADRKGSVLLALLLTVISITWMLVMVGHTRSTTVETAATRSLVAERALLECHAARRDLADQIVTLLTDPSEPGYVRLHALVREALNHQTPIDLTPFLPGPRSAPTLGWRRSLRDAWSPIGSSRTTFSATVEGLALFPPLGADSVPEGTARLVLKVDTETALAGVTARRGLDSTYELRIHWAGPPEPLAQIPLYLNDYSQFTDTALVNGEREKILGLVEDLKQLLERRLAGRQAGPELLERALLEQLKIPLDSRMPAVPEGAMVLTGPFTHHPFDFARLDLAGDLAVDRQELSTKLAALPPVGPAGSDPRLEEVASVYNRASMRLWGFARNFRTFRRDSDHFLGRMAVHEQTLDPAWWRSRIMVEIAENSPLIGDWKGGRRALIGIFAHETSAPLKLSGKLAGRCVLLVKAPRIDLEAIEPAGPGDLLTLVVEEGALRVSGHTRACVILTGNSHLELADEARLEGTLHLGSEAGLDISRGRLIPRPFRSEKLEGLPGTREPYAIVFDPDPVEEIQRAGDGGGAR